MASVLSFVSVRDDVEAPRLYSFRDALLTAYAEDGGMMLPAELPALSSACLDVWKAEASYRAIVLRIVELFLSPADIDGPTLQAVIERAYAPFHQPTPPLRSSCSWLQGYNDSSSAELSLTGVGLSGRAYYLLGLSHGPTLTFKDVALQPLAALLGQLSSSAASPRSAPVNIVVGTSGDTGSAAIEAVRGLRGTARIFVLYPRGRISPVQELQMTTVVDDAVHVIAVDGSSDELDVPIKTLFDDASFAREHRLCSINSVNAARIVLQMAHLVYATLAAAASCVSLSIPSGALGHLIAALLVQRLGLPIRRICVACNSNSPVPALLDSGVFRPSRSAHVTASNAMDIARPYNIERLVYLIALGSHVHKARRVRQCLRELDSAGECRLTADELGELRRLGVCAASVSDDDTLSTIRRVWQDNALLIEPHTAVGLAAAERTLLHTRDGERVLCVSTAHAAKFMDTVQRAVGDGVDVPQLLAHSGSPNVQRALSLHEQPTRCEHWSRHQDWTQLLRRAIEAADEPRHCAALEPHDRTDQDTALYTKPAQLTASHARDARNDRTH